MSDATLSPAILRRMRRLSLRQLIYFVELQHHGSFSRAAVALAISQPTLSQQIAQLEETLGVALLQRGTKLLRLSDDGELFLIRCRRILGMLGDAMEMLDGERRTKTLRLGIPSYLSYSSVTELLRQFRQRQPAVIPYLAEMPAEEMSQFLNEGELDAGFLTLPTPARLMEDMRSQTIWEAPYRVCLSRQHRLASKKILRAEDLAELDFVLVPRDYHRAHYDYQLNALRGLGIEPRIIDTDVSTTQSQMALAAAGLGACLISPGTAAIPDDLVLKETEAAIGTHALALFWPPASNNPLLKFFCDCARSFAAQAKQ
ncbi:LysR substrate-binding domain-containing protein (plasmid) [Rhizobium leguminosarum]